MIKSRRRPRRRVIVCINGTRDAPPSCFEKLCGVMADVQRMYKINRVVSGCAKGGDKLGERWARSAGIPITKCPPDWNTHGKAAGFIRNETMMQLSDVLVSVWDGSSRGTEHTIELFNLNGKPVFIVPYKELS